jgi:thioredoxin-like negative regulator of GroEL
MPASLTNTGDSGSVQISVGAILLFCLFGGGALLQQRQFRTPPDDSWFQARVIEQPGVVIVKFGAEWCPPCRSMHSSLKELQRRRAGELRILEIDIDEKPELASHYGIRAIPHTLLFVNGEFQTDLRGGAAVEQLEDWLAPYLRNPLSN